VRHKYTFNPSTRYLTKGIGETIPLELQLFMWSEIDKVTQNNEVDYLQVFEFKIEDTHIEIEHRQEEPEYKKIFKLKMREEYTHLSNLKIFVIDDIDHSTMLLASEY
jgi:hypothetical protein